MARYTILSKNCPKIFYLAQSHTEKIPFKGGYDYRHRDSLKTYLYCKITLKYYKLNTKHLKLFFATSHAKFYQSATQAQNLYKDKKFSMNFLFTIYGTIYTTTYSGIFSAKTLYTVVFLRLGTMGSLKYHYTAPLCICLISEQDIGFLYIGVYSYGIALYSNRHSSLI